MDKMIRPSDKIAISIHSSSNKVTVSIPCYLHISDELGLYDVLFQYLKTCNKTETFIDRMEVEAEERGKRNG